MLFMSLAFFILFFMHYINNCKNVVELKMKGGESSGDFRFLSVDIIHLIVFMVLVIITVLITDYEDQHVLYTLREMFILYMGAIVLSNLLIYTLNRWIKTTRTYFAVYVSITTLYFVLLIFVLPFKL